MGLGRSHLCGWRSRPAAGPTHLILLVIAALALWVGWLYAAPFGRCPKCQGTGHIKHTRKGKRGRQLVKVKVCPRCKGRRRVQRRGSRTIHRLARKIRDGRQAAARYQEDSDGTP
jgi:Ribonuclease G/E